jgi:hypothetical protein
VHHSPRRRVSDLAAFAIDEVSIGGCLWLLLLLVWALATRSNLVGTLHQVLVHSD